MKKTILSATMIALLAGTSSLVSYNFADAASHQTFDDRDDSGNHRINHDRGFGDDHGNHDVGDDHGNDDVGNDHGNDDGGHDHGGDDGEGHD